jgi:hypothetical protein
LCAFSASGFFKVGSNQPVTRRWKRGDGVDHSLGERASPSSSPNQTWGIDTFHSTIEHERVHSEQVKYANQLVPPPLDIPFVPNASAGFLGTFWQWGWSWNTSSAIPIPLPHNHWGLGADHVPGFAVDADGDAESADFPPAPPFELGAPGSDDVLLDASAFGPWLTDWPRGRTEANCGSNPACCQVSGNCCPGGIIEDEAWLGETPENDLPDLYELDWANPGKQHLSRSYND